MDAADPGRLGALFECGPVGAGIGGEVAPVAAVATGGGIAEGDAGCGIGEHHGNAASRRLRHSGWVRGGFGRRSLQCFSGASRAVGGGAAGPMRHGIVDERESAQGPVGGAWTATRVRAIDLGGRGGEGGGGAVDWGWGDCVSAGGASAHDLGPWGGVAGLDGVTLCVCRLGVAARRGHGGAAARTGGGGGTRAAGDGRGGA